MWSFFLIFQLSFIIFGRLTTKITTESELRSFEVTAKSFKIFEDLMGKFTSMASNDSLMSLVLSAFINYQLIENRYDKNSSFSHTWLCLAKNVSTLNSGWNSIDLNFTGMFKAAFTYPSLEFIFQEKFIPTSQVSTKLSLSGSFIRLDFFLVRTLFIVRYIHDSNYLKITTNSKMCLSFTNKHSLIFIE